MRFQSMTVRPYSAIPFGMFGGIMEFPADADATAMLVHSVTAFCAAATPVGWLLQVQRGLRKADSSSLLL